MDEERSIVPYDENDADDSTRPPTTEERASTNALATNNAGTRNLDMPEVFEETPPSRLRFLIREGNGRVEVPANVSCVIGRKSMARQVEVDLLPYDALEMGISRQHVKIEPRGRSFVVKDLHSINGTTLNHKAMIPGHYYELSDGDELKLGRMHIVVRYVWGD